MDFEEALRRATADPSRGLSKDRDFLAAHYRTVGNAPEIDGDFMLDTADVSISLAARSVVDWLLAA